MIKVEATIPEPSPTKVTIELDPDSATLVAGLLLSIAIDRELTTLFETERYKLTEVTGKLPREIIYALDIDERDLPVSVSRAQLRVPDDQ